MTVVLSWLPLDLLRVAVAVPTFAYATVLDLRERRVPHVTWLPLATVGALALAIDALNADVSARFAFLVGISLALGGAFGIGFYRIGAFGGADRVAIIVLALAFPVYPTLVLPVFGELPIIVPNAPIFVLSVLGDAVLVGLAYPAALLVGNIRRGDRGRPWLMLMARRVPVGELHEHYGKIIEAPDGAVSLRRSGLFRPHGGVTDVDLVRDYVAWRDADDLRDAVGDVPDAAPQRTAGDGEPGGERGSEDGAAEDGDDAPTESDVPPAVADAVDLQGFLDDHPAWASDDVAGDAAELAALARADAVWITPGIPFVVPLTVGLVLALTAGDLLFLAFQSLFGL